MREEINNIVLLGATSELIYQYGEDLMRMERNSQLSQIWELENYLSDLPKKWEFSTFLLLNNQLAGVAVISEKTPYSCHLHRFIIDERVRGRGVGSHFIVKLKNKVKKTHRFFTLMVPIDNVKASNFYENNGFYPILQQDDNVVMIKNFV